VAITPFNYPALLVMHKLAPALAAGNAVVLKPARTTPLTALALAACFVDAGLPDGVLSVLTGPGGELGDALVSDPRVRKVSFTGSTRTGERITQVAGVKKLSLELGASCPVVILPDADLGLASSVAAAGGPAGNGCRSTPIRRARGNAGSAPPSTAVGRGDWSGAVDRTSPREASSPTATPPVPRPVVPQLSGRFASLLKDQYLL
jgi:acyl-CoA reductase-like NAD-dependent aldehyde dehydrogenase